MYKMEKVCDSDVNYRLETQQVLCIDPTFFLGSLFLKTLKIILL